MNPEVLYLVLLLGGRALVRWLGKHRTGDWKGNADDDIPFN